MKVVLADFDEAKLHRTVQAFEDFVAMLTGELNGMQA